MQHADRHSDVPHTVKLWDGEACIINMLPAVSCATRLCLSMYQPAMKWRLAGGSHALKGQHCGVLPRVHCSSSAGPGSGAAQSWCCWYCRFWTTSQVADPRQRTALQLALLRHGQTGTWPHRPRPWFRAPQMATRPSSRAKQKVTTHHWHALSKSCETGLVEHWPGAVSAADYPLCYDSEELMSARIVCDCHAFQRGAA